MLCLSKFVPSALLLAGGTVAKIMAKYDFTPAEAVPDGLTAGDICPAVNR